MDRGGRAPTDRRPSALKRFLRILFGAAVAIVLLLAIAVATLLGPGNAGRLFFGIGRSYDDTPPILPALKRPAVLVFSKTNGFRDDAQIKAATAALTQIARSRGWSVYATENAAIFNARQLQRFDVAVWNSVSGDVLTTAQRAAFRAWLEHGGGFVGLHGAGGDPSYAWRWYVDDLIGAQFIGHTMGPQFQQASLQVEDAAHPATRRLHSPWVRTDEWYSFASSPRAKGYHVLVSIDETSYTPLMKLFPFTKGKDIRMGAVHPLVWWHCVGNGRAFYSALGHTASSYSEPAHLRMIAGALLQLGVRSVEDLSDGW